MQIEGQQFISAILNTDSFLVVVLDSQGRIRHFNQACEQTTGFTAGEVEGKFVWDFLLLPDEIEPVRAVFEALQSGRFPNRHENYWLTRAGSRRLIAWANSALLDEQGCVAYVIGIGIDITEGRQAEESLRRKVEELSALHQTVLDITSPHKLPDLLQTIVERAARLLNASSGGLYLCDPDREEVRCMFSYNTQRDYAGTVLKYGEGAAGHVAQTGKPLIIEDYRTWTGRAAAYEEDQPFTAVASAPMIWQGSVTGVIHVLQTEEGRSFTQDDLDRLTLFADQATIAVENAKLYEKAQLQAHQAETLRQAGSVVAATLDQDEAIERILVELERVGPYDSASVQLLRNGYLEIVGGRGWPDPKAVVGLHFPVPGDNPNTVVIQTCRPHILGDAPGAFSPFRTGPHNHIRSWLGVPLILHDTVIGMLAIDSAQPNTYTADHARLVSAFADQVAIALENARLYSMEKQRVKELDALRATVADISAELEQTRLLQAVLVRAVELLNATGGDLGLYDEAMQEIVIVVSHNLSKDYTGTRMSLGEGAMGHVAQTRQPLIIDDYMQWSRRSPQYEAGPWHAVLAAPMVISNRLVGVIGVVDADQTRRFTPSDERMMILFAQQSAIAIDNARLYASEKKRAAELALLFQSSIDITKTIDLQSALNIAAQQLGKAVNATSAYILSYDQESGLAIVLSDYLGPEANELEQISDLGTTYYLKTTPKLFQALRNGQPWVSLVNDPNADLATREELMGRNVMSALALPMMVAGQVRGYAEIWDNRSERAWNEEEIRLCQTLANQAAIAIENARLFEESQYQAVTDPLTGLYNRRGLFQLGDREVERVRRFEHPLAAVLLDIDHFKQTNDTYSHAIGDQVLRALADCCRATIRDTDILGRYGGEEFALLLPETDAKGAYNLAERLREKVAMTPVLTERGAIDITISLGVASYTEQIPDLAVLLDHADTAMYAAKQSGRNTVVVG